MWHKSDQDSGGNPTPIVEEVSSVKYRRISPDARGLMVMSWTRGEVRQGKAGEADKHT